MDTNWLNDLADRIERAEVKRLKAELDRLKSWRELYEAAPAGAKDVVLKRAAMTEAISPIIKSWKDEVERLKAEVAQAERRGAVKALRRAAEILDVRKGNPAGACLDAFAARIESGEEAI